MEYRATDVDMEEAQQWRGIRVDETAVGLIAISGHAASTTFTEGRERVSTLPLLYTDAVYQSHLKVTIPSFSFVYLLFICTSDTLLRVSIHGMIIMFDISRTYMTRGIEDGLYHV